MTVFDTDVLVEILVGNSRFVSKAIAVPPDQQAVAVITLEEILRGRLHAIRRAEAGQGPIAVTLAYDLLAQSLDDFRHVSVLPYTAGADALFQNWREQKVRVSTHDLRIAAICVDHSATLVSRNRRHFDQVPGLSVEFWE
jgi:tRNA(fMet)-specific endonuclease VapC